jgi:SsrA-binding protein
VIERRRALRASLRDPTVRRQRVQRAASRKGRKPDRCAHQRDTDHAPHDARITDGEVWLIGAKIAQYEKASITNHPPLRNRKLLLHRNQIKKLVSKLELSGFTLIPLRIYFNDRGIAKVELGIARGKRQFDKRSKITEREQKRDIDRSTKRFRAK